MEDNTHNWGEEDFDWQGLDAAGYFIGDWLRLWAHMQIRQIKEKFGTLRIYCSFGYSCFYSIWRPSHMWIPKYWPYRLDLWISHNTPIMRLINRFVIPVQIKLYIWRYKKAVRKWPHLKEEILCCADYSELLEKL